MHPIQALSAEWQHLEKYLQEEKRWQHYPTIYYVQISIHSIIEFSIIFSHLNIKNLWQIFYINTILILKTIFLHNLVNQVCIILKTAFLNTNFNISYLYWKLGVCTLARIYIYVWFRIFGPKISLKLLKVERITCRM
jgi:magnesium-transporting ATPase (P-type)